MRGGATKKLERGGLRKNSGGRGNASRPARTAYGPGLSRRPGGPRAVPDAGARRFKTRNYYNNYQLSLAVVSDGKWTHRTARYNVLDSRRDFAGPRKICRTIIIAVVRGGGEGGGGLCVRLFNDHSILYNITFNIIQYCNCASRALICRACRIPTLASDRFCRSKRNLSPRRALYGTRITGGIFLFFSNFCVKSYFNASGYRKIIIFAYTPVVYKNGARGPHGRKFVSCPRVPV